MRIEYAPILNERVTVPSCIPPILSISQHPYPSLSIQFSSIPFSLSISLLLIQPSNLLTFLQPFQFSCIPSSLPIFQHSFQLYLFSFFSARFRFIPCSLLIFLHYFQLDFHAFLPAFQYSFNNEFSV